MSSTNGAVNCSNVNNNAFSVSGNTGNSAPHETSFFYKRPLSLVCSTAGFVGRTLANVPRTVGMIVGGGLKLVYDYPVLMLPLLVGAAGEFAKVTGMPIEPTPSSINVSTPLIMSDGGLQGDQGFNQCMKQELNVIISGHYNSRNGTGTFQRADPDREAQVHRIYCDKQEFCAPVTPYQEGSICKMQIEGMDGSNSSSFKFNNREIENVWHGKGDLSESELANYQKCVNQRTVIVNSQNMTSLEADVIRTADCAERSRATPQDLPQEDGGATLGFASPTEASVPHIQRANAHRSWVSSKDKDEEPTHFINSSEPPAADLPILPDEPTQQPPQNNNGKNIGAAIMVPLIVVGAAAGICAFSKSHGKRDYKPAVSV